MFFFYIYNQRHIHVGIKVTWKSIRKANNYGEIKYIFNRFPVPWITTYYYDTRDTICTKTGKFMNKISSHFASSFLLDVVLPRNECNFLVWWRREYIVLRRKINKIVHINNLQKSIWGKNVGHYGIKNRCCMGTGTC